MIISNVFVMDPALHECTFFCVDLFLDWKQNAYEVIVRLNCGDAGVLRVEDVDSAFSDSACHIRLPGKDSMCACGHRIWSIFVFFVIVCCACHVLMSVMYTMFQMFGPVRCFGKLILLFSKD